MFLFILSCVMLGAMIAGAVALPALSNSVWSLGTGALARHSEAAPLDRSLQTFERVPVFEDWLYALAEAEPLTGHVFEVAEPDSVPLLGEVISPILTRPNRFASWH